MLTAYTDHVVWSLLERLLNQNAVTINKSIFQSYASIQSHKHPSPARMSPVSLQILSGLHLDTLPDNSEDENARLRNPNPHQQTTNTG